MERIIKSLRNDSIRAYQFHQSLRLGAVILLSIFLVKLGMDVEEVSTFEWILFITNALSFFWSMGMKNAMMNFRPNIPEGGDDDFLKTLMLSFLGVSVVISLGVAFLSGVGLVDMKGLLWVIVAYLIFNVPSSILEHIFLWKGKATQIFDYAALSYSGYLLIIVAGYIAFDYQINGAIAGLLLWSFLRFLYFLYYLISHVGRYDFRLFGVFFMFSIPLILHVLIGNGMEFIDGFLVDHYFGEDWFAIYRFGARELPFNTVLISSLVTASIPLAVKALHDTMKDLKVRISILMDWLYPLCIVLIFTNGLIFRLVYSDDYALSADIFNVYLLIIVSRVLLPQIVLYARQKNSILMYATIIEVVLNLVLSLFFLKIYGVIGIAYATVIAFVTQKVILIAYNHIVLNIRLSDYLPVQKYTLYSVALFASFFIEKYLITW